MKFSSTRHASGPGLARVLFKVFAGLLFLAAVFPASFAQISPGPLSRPHASLSGPTHCARCHKFGGHAALKCLECHTEIASRLAEHKGLHSTYRIQPGSSQGCARCHSEHNGKEFPLVKWDTKKFKHNVTGYNLEGKHAGLACNKCHNPSHISPQQRPSIKQKDLSRTYLGLSAACGSCHEDAHKGRLGVDCRHCHNFVDWKAFNATRFDHSKTRYSLTGLHGKVKCDKCHTAASDGKVQYAGLAFGQCSDCHKDPHHKAFSQGCDSCHNTNGWKRVSLRDVSRRFDHSRTKYALAGKHAILECSKCHAKGDFKKTLAFAKCTDCHKDSHNGQFAKRSDKGECSSCHNVQGWKPSLFTAKDHAATSYPLKSGHARVQCSKCHLPKGKDTLFKVKFAHCTDCHRDRHAGQFAAAPYFNACDRCHNLQGYKPSTFTIAKHQKTRFALAGGHIATPCADCHKKSAKFQPKPTAVYRWKNLTCTSCHKDPHKGQFRKRMLQVRADGSPAGCEACHTPKSWKKLAGFKHSTTKFALTGAHRATACIDCHKPPNFETTMRHVDFTSAPKQCEDCHEDAHGRQFAKAGVTRCAACHTTMKWKPSLFDHEKRGIFSLRGAHQRVRCAKCHTLTKVVNGKAVLFYKPTPKDCAACHGPAIRAQAARRPGS